MLADVDRGKILGRYVLRDGFGRPIINEPSSEYESMVSIEHMCDKFGVYRLKRRPVEVHPFDEAA